MAACYLLLPYTRMALVDSGQLIPAALIVGGGVLAPRAGPGGALIGLAAGWIPACLGLIALWCGFYRGRGACAIHRWSPWPSSSACALLGHWVPGLARLGARPGCPEHRRGRPLAAVRAAVRRQLLGEHRLQLPAPGPDRLPGPGDRHDALAGREEPRRADRPVGGPAGRQPVLVPRQGGHAGDALPAAGDRDDVPADPRDPQAGWRRCHQRRANRPSLPSVLSAIRARTHRQLRSTVVAIDDEADTSWSGLPP